MSLRTRIWCILFGAGALLSIRGAAYGQDLAVSASIENPDSLLIGDHIRLNLSAAFPEENQDRIVIHWPIMLDTVNRLEIVRLEELDTLVGEGKTTIRQRIVVSAYDSGAYLIKPIPIAYQKEGRTAFDTVYTRPLLVAVNTLQVDTSKGIAPIKAPLDVPYTLRDFLPYIGGLVALGLLVALILFLIRRRKKEESPVIRPKPALPPHIIAKQKLQELEDQKLWQKGEVKTYYVRLSEIVREYIEFRFDTLALESTTDEIIRSLHGKEVGAPDIDRLQALLEISDLVKFAKFNPLPDQHLDGMSKARDFVIRTQPKAQIIEPNKEEAHV